MIPSRIVKLPSGAELNIRPAPFAQAKALYQAALEELKEMKLDPKAEVDVNFFKDIFCAGFSSKKVEKCLDDCMANCTYNNLKIDGDTFEPVETRQDYGTVLFEIASENIQPFTKALMQQYSRVLGLIKKPPA